ncbi:MAG TPA: GTPase HflX [Saprospiraceae bacterium]|nr:GTPase HflX [Saprospiraceae bacterium]
MGNDWNIGSKNKAGIQKNTERAVIVGLIYGDQTEEKVQEFLDELEFLALTAGAVTVKRYVQSLPHPDPALFMGSGKLEEIKEFIEDNDIDLVIFDDDLSGKQVRNIEKMLKRKIIDRSSLILDIFAERAQTAQAKTQVELAQMQYLLPRLRGLWTHLERQRGGIGMRGPGEKEIETDRRIVRDQISKLKKKLQKIDQQNRTQRKNRGEFIRVSLVGYTNVGKSTLMNRLSKSDVFAENKLFATLDTTVRKVVFGRMPFLMSDTVGFIRKLPTHLIESFKSTLDEVRESDLLLHVFDVAHPQYEDHIRSVNETLKDMECLEKPTILIGNKIDLYREKKFDDLLDDETKEELETALLKYLKSTYNEDCVLISAHTKEGVNELRQHLGARVREMYEERYPYKVQHW